MGLLACRRTSGRLERGIESIMHRTWDYYKKESDTTVNYLFMQFIHMKVYIARKQNITKPLKQNQINDSTGDQFKDLEFLERLKFLIVLNFKT